MRKVFTKIICFTAAAVAALGIFLVSACTYNVKPLTGNIFTSDKAVGNGGFAVEKGDYVYFINGNRTYTDDNTFGSVVKGAIMRISKDDLSKRNYSKVDTVVPQIIYSGNSNAGIFVYGDYIYYSTPSTEKNSDGEVQNSNLAFKRTKLDGTDTTRDYFVQYSDNSVEYRYVEEDGVVYLVYVAKNENLYGTSYTNIHSVNTSTGENKLLAYNVDTVTFDKTDLTNSRIYYTMSVKDFVTDTAVTSYNQIYTVKANETQPKDYSEYFNEIYKDKEEDYDPETDPLYLNCGTLVFDGIGKVDGMLGSVTPFNGEGADKVERSAYTYTVSNYENGVLYYTRTSSLNSASLLFAAKESDILASGWKPVSGNPEYTECLLRDGSSAGSYIYLYDSNKTLNGALIADAAGLVKAEVKDGKLVTENDNSSRFYLTKDGQATLLFTAVHNNANYIYYSLTGGNGYTVYRVCYGGNYSDYNMLPVGDDVNEYTPVRILDLDCASDWYLPEMVEGQLLFQTQTENMTEYSYIMVCDLRARENGQATNAVMTNKQIDELNDLYESVDEKISEIDETVYENLQNALKYAYYTGDGEYIDTLIKAYVDILEYDEERFWSKESVEIYKEFVKATADGKWSDFSDTITVNGETVSANKQSYYYSLLGVMSDEDAEAYDNLLKTTYLQAYPEKEQTWFEGLSTGAKCGFIIGVCLGGLVIIAAAVVVTLVIIRKRKEKLPDYTKKRIKVDTTDDKNIDVYSYDEQPSENTDAE